MRLPTLLVAADGDLRVSLHIHHDTALPVSLGVDRHLVACSTERRSDASVILPYILCSVERQAEEFSPDEVGVSCGVSAGYVVSLLLLLFLLPLDGTVAKRPAGRETATHCLVNLQQANRGSAAEGAYEASQTKVVVVTEGKSMKRSKNLVRILIIGM